MSWTDCRGQIKGRHSKSVLSQLQNTWQKIKAILKHNLMILSVNLCIWKWEMDGLRLYFLGRTKKLFWQIGYEETKRKTKNATKDLSNWMWRSLLRRIKLQSLGLMVEISLICLSDMYEKMVSEQSEIGDWSLGLCFWAGDGNLEIVIV